MMAVLYGRVFGGMALAVLLAVACSGENEHPPFIGGAYDKGGKGGSAGLGGSSSGGTLNIDVTGEGAEPSLGGAPCAGEVSRGEVTPLDVHVMLDTSLSMLEATGPGTNRWEGVKEALEAFLLDESSAGIGVGIQYFPHRAAGVPQTCETDDECGAAGPCDRKFCATYSQVAYCTQDSDCEVEDPQGDVVDFGPCIDLAHCSGNPLYACNSPGAACLPDSFDNDLGICTAAAGSCLQSSSCDIEDYSTPAEPIRVLPRSAETILDSIAAREPEGSTPTAAALQGAVSYASAWAADHPDHTVVTLLATDGFPTQCDPTDFGPIAAIAQAGWEGTPRVATYVIGVFPPGDMNAKFNLDLVAWSGGTEHAFIVDTSEDVAGQFLSALTSIRTRLTCELKVPKAPKGATLDYDGLVNVQFSLDDETVVLPYVRAKGECDDEGGWYYDLDPAGGGTPTKILVCPTTCDMFEESVGAEVEIKLGCVTETVVVK